VEKPVGHLYADTVAGPLWPEGLGLIFKAALHDKLVSNEPISFRIYGLILLCLCVSACGRSGDDVSVSDTGPPTVADVAPEYVGMSACESCHADQVSLWQGSHHDLAMQPAVDPYVRGDFNDAQFDHNDVVTRLSQRDGQLTVLTDGADGQLAEFPVRYTFGVEPLQQYLVELPDGQIQSLPVAWDSRAVGQGGQRWFHVYGDDPIDHTDVLHWTRMTQNWSSQCADCHSTGLVKEFDLQTQLFETSWAEINVACEACHGPASRHVAWARQPDDSASKGLTVELTELRGITWKQDKATGNSRRSSPRTTQTELNTCGSCHSRRARITKAQDTQTGGEFLDAYLPAMIHQPLYYADGQIRDEVYVYGSFLQSRMAAHGVTCSDCHEPHSLQLRAPGDQVCTQCHEVTKFATTDHHFHSENSPGSACVDCHMPATTYMQIDARRDHSLRIPRPQLSVVSDVPNACNGCHADRDAQWAVDELSTRGKLASGHWTERMTLANLAPASRDLWLGLATDIAVPPIIRASAMSQLRLAGDEAAVTALGGWAASANPMVRWGVAQAMQTADPAARARYLPELLDDSVKAVRITAASAAASLSLESLPTNAYPKLEAAIEEYIAAQMTSPERAESHVNMANLYRQLNRPDQSERSYRDAIRLNPFFVPAYVNLSDLYRVRGRESEGEELLRDALARIPDQPSLHFALGLLYIREGRVNEALAELQIAADSENANARFALAYALAIDAQGESLAATEYLQAALERFGDSPVLVSALMNIYQRTGNEEAARALAQRLQRR
jgi:tetratricopeptide (TPR) repeat protein